MNRLETKTKTTTRVSLAARRSATIATAALLGVFVTAGSAFATTYTDPASVITPAGSELKTDLLAVAGSVAVLGVVILGVRKGWALMKRFF